MPSEATTITPALLTIAQVCEVLNISRAEFYRLDASGKFTPLRVGLWRKVLYRKSEIEGWIDAGCPHRRIWSNMKKEFLGMNGRKKQADGETVAKRDQEQDTACPNDAAPATAKERIGELLLSLVTGNASEEDWRRFKGLLRQYYDRAYRGR